MLLLKFWLIEYKKNKWINIYTTQIETEHY